MRTRVVFLGTEIGCPVELEVAGGPLGADGLSKVIVKGLPTIFTSTPVCVPPKVVTVHCLPRTPAGGVSAATVHVGFAEPETPVTPVTFDKEIAMIEYLVVLGLSSPKE
jgi:hypothetical protein